MKFISQSAALFASLALAAIGARADTVVPGNANIYGAGHASAPGPGGGGGGIVPISVGVTGGDVLSFQVTGQVSDNGGGNFYGPDGYVASGTLVNPLGGLSGIKHPARIFLAGVFLDDQEPAGSPPSMIDYSGGALASYSPMLNQVFFIGDGLTGTGTGSVQDFFAPSGATRLFLGFTDGSNVTGLPGDFVDNISSLQVKITEESVSEPAPLPATFPAAIALLIVGGLVRMRHRRIVSLPAINPSLSDA